MTNQPEHNKAIMLASEIVVAYVANNSVPRAELPALIIDVHAAVKRLYGGTSDTTEEKLSPAVPIKRSVTPNFIVCLEDGRQFKSLKRHLSTHHGLTPDEYRAKWGLPANYPMVAPAYASTRSALAKKMGLGRNRTTMVQVDPMPAKPTRKRTTA